MVYKNVGIENEKSNNIINTQKMAKNKQPNHKHNTIRNKFQEFNEKEEQLQKIYCMTWNMNGRPPPQREDLEKYIQNEIFDIYVFGTEECGTSIQKAQLFTSKTRWVSLQTEILGSRYIEVTSVTMQAVHQILFVRKEVSQFINNVAVEQVPTGIGGFLGNKGGVAISLDIGKTSFLFISSHFQSGEMNVYKRNSDFARINTRLTLRSNHVLQHPNIYKNIDNDVLQEGYRRKESFQYKYQKPKHVDSYANDTVDGTINGLHRNSSIPSVNGVSSDNSSSMVCPSKTSVDIDAYQVSVGRE